MGQIATSEIAIKSISRGFTLLEVLVVMFIAGISIGVTGLAISSGANSRIITAEANKLGKWFIYVHNHSVINSKTYSILLDEGKTSLSIQEYKDREWKDSMLDNNVFKLRNEIKAQLIFNDEELSQLRLYPDSSYTPFKLQLIIDKKTKISINGDGTELPSVSKITTLS